ncbi:MAG: ComF family protein, partial [Vicinamibacterales bacterium]
MQIADLINTLRSAIVLSSNALLSVVLAPACAACDEALLHPIRGPVCERCWASIRSLTPPLCDRCGDPLPTWRSVSIDLARCPRCRRSAHALDRARAIGAYDGSLRAIVHALKYEGRRSLARPLGRLMRERGAALIEGAACAIPVP